MPPEMEIEQDASPTGCPEKRFLERSVAKAFTAVQILRNQAHDKRNAATAVWLNPAREIYRDAQRALQGHVKEHGCG